MGASGKTAIPPVTYSYCGPDVLGKHSSFTYCMLKALIKIKYAPSLTCPSANMERAPFIANTRKIGHLDSFISQRHGHQCHVRTPAPPPIAPPPPFGFSPCFSTDKVDQAPRPRYGGLLTMVYYVEGGMGNEQKSINALDRLPPPLFCEAFFIVALAFMITVSCLELLS